MNKVIIFVLAVFSILSCTMFTEKKEVAGPDEKYQMMEADKAFSKMSVEKGMKAALEYRDKPFGGIMGRYPAPKKGRRR